MTTLTTEAPAQTEPRSRAPLAAVTLAYAALVAWITLGPQDAVADFRAIVEGLAQASGFPFAPVSPLLSLMMAQLDFEAAANVLMFVPFGILAALWSPRSGWFVLAMIGVAVSCVIEVAQFFLPGRTPDLHDVFANGAGMALGSLLIVVARALDRVTPPES